MPLNISVVRIHLCISNSFEKCKKLIVFKALYAVGEDASIGVESIAETGKVDELLNNPPDPTYQDIASELKPLYTGESFDWVVLDATTENHYFDAIAMVEFLL